MLSCVINNSFALGDTLLEQNSYYDQRGNYNNPETGEYFRWTNIDNRALEKSFEFKIRYKVTSGNFFLTTSNVRVWIDDEHFETYAGATASCCSSHRFSVNVSRFNVTNNYAYFKAPIYSSVYVNLGGGFAVSPTPYTLTVTNQDGLAGDNCYLAGRGTINTY